MKASEFPAYCDYLVPDYAAELTRNYGYPMAKSVALARKDIAEDLPQGVATPGTSFSGFGIWEWIRSLPGSSLHLMKRRLHIGIR